MSETVNQIIESDVQLSKRILSVASRSFNLDGTIKFPKSKDDEGNVIEWHEIKVKDLFPNIFNADLTVGNLTEAELRAIRIGNDLNAQIINYAFRYNRFSLIEVALLVADKVNNIVVSSRGRNMEGAKLAKTQLTQSMQEQFHRQYIEEEEKEKKKGFLGKWF